MINLTKQRFIICYGLLAICIAVSACQPANRHFNYSIFAFGTLIDISFYDTDKDLAEKAFEQLQKDFDRYHQDWSPWTDGDLAVVNKKLKSDSVISVPEHLIPILQSSIELSRQSENYYNPAIGKLINLWQFHRYQDNDIKPPDDKKIQQLVDNKPRMSDLSIDDSGQLHSKNTAISLNFGAFAKGYAITQEMKKLQEMGIHNAVINAGGDLSVIGKVISNDQQKEKRQWNIGIRNPRDDTLIASVELNENESVFTSGDYERFYHYQGKRYHHILDPNTGYPTRDMQSVTVIHSDAGRADAAATALLVAGRKNWQRIAKNMAMDQVMLIDRDKNIHLTKKMAKRVKFLDKSSTLHIILSEQL